jgi:hypothetical protein
MPHHPDDQRYGHLRLAKPESSHERRKQFVIPKRHPARGSRSAFAAKLTTRLEEIEHAVEEAPRIAPRVSPHLVFRVPLAPGAPVETIMARLRRLFLTVVSLEPDNAIVAFQQAADLRAFRSAVSKYGRGPRGKAKTTQWDLLEFIEAEAMRPWQREDRIGPRLAAALESLAPDRLLTVQVELWHPGDRGQTQRLADEVGRVVAMAHDHEQRVLDRFVGELIAIVKARIRVPTLELLFQLSSVAEVDLPPVPVFDAAAAFAATARHFPVPAAPPPDGPRLCILDSGITASHPLLGPFVGHEEAILTHGETAADQHGHGTMVAGVAVFGDPRACYLAGTFQSEITLYSARVLNDRNEFDDERLFVQQVLQAISIFKKPPYNCRVFNLSLGTKEPALSGPGSKQSLWAEALDVIARDENVLLVVSAGNCLAAVTDDPARAEEMLNGYPHYLLGREFQLCDPATAASPLTVGALSRLATPGLQRNGRADDLARCIAQPRQPAPFTRLGPGINRAVKPELVADGGNLVFQGYGPTRRVAKDHGCSVLSLSHEPTRRLFAFDVGSSLAAPQVARLAAILWHRLETVGEGPDPNLVRAVLAATASVPTESDTLLRKHHRHEYALCIAGYGEVDGALAAESADRTATLIAQHRLTLDHFVIFELPMVPEFRDAPGPKSVSIALAFDPPVRRRRKDYLGVEMTFDLVRGRTLAQVESAYRKLKPEEKPDRKERKHLVELVPSSIPREPTPCRRYGTLQRASWEFTSGEAPRGEMCWLVVRALRRWAPAMIDTQDFSVAVTMRATEPFYHPLRARLAERVRAKARRRT